MGETLVLILIIFVLQNESSHFLLLYTHIMKIFDMSRFFRLRFQDRVSIFIHSIIEFNDHLIFIALLILSFIIYILVITLVYNHVNLLFFESHILEFIWTLAPLFILVFIAFPSIKILYIIEENDYCISLKVVGHQ